MNKRIAKKILSSDNYFDIWKNKKGQQLVVPMGGRHYFLIQKAFSKLHLNWEEFITEIIGIAVSNAAVKEYNDDKL